MKKVVTMTRISRGGQVTVPAPIRRRWETERVALEDHGDHLLLRPLADPIEAFLSFAGEHAGPTSEQMRARSRAEEKTAAARRGG